MSLLQQYWRLAAQFSVVGALLGNLRWCSGHVYDQQAAKEAVNICCVLFCLLSSTLGGRHNIVDERKSMLDACNAFLAAKGPNRTFLGGDEPNLADLVCYYHISTTSIISISNLRPSTAR